MPSPTLSHPHPQNAHQLGARHVPPEKTRIAIHGLSHLRRPGSRKILARHICHTEAEEIPVTSYTMVLIPHHTPWLYF